MTAKGELTTALMVRVPPNLRAQIERRAGRSAKARSLKSTEKGRGFGDCASRAQPRPCAKAALADPR